MVLIDNCRHHLAYVEGFFPAGIGDIGEDFAYPREAVFAAISVGIELYIPIYGINSRCTPWEALARRYVSQVAVSETDRSFGERQPTASRRPGNPSYLPVAD
jgi:hypothetical protein